MVGNLWSNTNVKVMTDSKRRLRDSISQEKSFYASHVQVPKCYTVAITSNYLSPINNLERKVPIFANGWLRPAAAGQRRLAETSRDDRPVSSNYVIDFIWGRRERMGACRPGAEVTTYVAGYSKKILTLWRPNRFVWKRKYLFLT